MVFVVRSKERSTGCQAAYSEQATKSMFEKLVEFSTATSAAAIDGVLSPRSGGSIHSVVKGAERFQESSREEASVDQLRRSVAGNVICVEFRTASV